MLSFVHSWMAPKCNPIGVDFGSECLRLAQVSMTTGEARLVAAASADVPAHVRHDPAARMNFFVDAVRDLLSQGKFRGREAILGLPAAQMFIQHLRMPKMDADGMKKALPWELRGKLPIDPNQAQLRHIIAGDVYEGQEAKSEVVVIAAARDAVNQFLANAAKAKLDVIGMNVEARSIVDCFQHVYRRKSDEGIVNCFVDIGAVATRVVIACGPDILFARTIPVGGDHLSRATAAVLKIKLEDAKILRAQIALQQVAEEPKSQVPPATVEVAKPQADEAGEGEAAGIENSFALLSAGMQMDRRRDLAVAPIAPPKPETQSQTSRMEEACAQPLSRIVEELELCRRYHETTFPNSPVQRLIFIGGEARQKALCQSIARQLGVAAQIGDPMIRLGKTAELPADCGLDVTQPQPAWAVAIGLSMGAAVVAAAKSK